jgi:arylsulfatase A-like enzyme
LTVGFYRPHVPWYVPQPWLDIFEEDSIRTPAYDPKDMEDVPAMGRQVSDVPMMPTTEWMIRTGKWKAAVRAYLASMAFVDAQVGRVLDALDRSGHAKNTIVVLLSDHGYHLGEKNRFAKQALWERDTRVPLIIRRPGGFAGASSGASVQLLDIYPTLADLCGLKLSAAIDGHSLQPLLKDPVAKWKHPALVSYGPGNMAVRDDRYRLIRYEDGSEEWYDILKDPNEWRNLAGNKSVAKRFETLRAHIPKEWAASSKYVKYPVNDYFEARYGKGGE